MEGLDVTTRPNITDVDEGQDVTGRFETRISSGMGPSRLCARAISNLVGNDEKSEDEESDDKSESKEDKRGCEDTGKCLWTVERPAWLQKDRVTRE